MNSIKIDTANNLITKVVLIKGSQSYEMVENRSTPGDQNVLELIEKLISDNHMQLGDLNSIEIKDGPGSFTGLRVGAAISNALSFSLQISVNGKVLGEIVEPQY